jgi:hypothetical protein
MILRLARASVSNRKADAFSLLRQSVPAGVRPMIGPTLELQAEILGVARTNRYLQASGKRRARFDPLERERPPVQAEVFTDGTALYIVTLDPSERADRIRTRISQAEGDAEFVLRLSCVAADPNVPGLSEFHDRVNTTFGVVLEPYTYTSRRFDELKKEGRESPSACSAADLAAARLLQDKTHRALAIAIIKSAGGLLVRDLAKQLPEGSRDRVTEVQTTLRDAGLLESEIVVVCKKTQAQVARASTREVLRQSSNSGLRCACGRPISDEQIEEALTITQSGRDHLTKSRWLTTLVLSELVAVGVPLTRTLVEQQAGGDELDILAELSGELVFFELKDKAFNVGDAYSFGAKIGIVQPQHSVIVTTSHVGNDAKEHFQRARSARSARSSEFGWDQQQEDEIHYIEGVESLRSEIRRIASKIYANDAIKLLNRVRNLALLDSEDVVSAIEMGQRDVQAIEPDTTSTHDESATLGAVPVAHPR